MSEDKVPEEGTRIDLGEDLLEETSPAAPVLSDQPTEESKEYDVNDSFKSAEILIGEGLLEDAKRVLRKILRTDPDYAQAKKKLHEIHEIELKQLFNDNELVYKGFKTQTTIEADLGKPEESYEIMRNLDRDLALGLFETELLPPASELSLFKDKEALRAYGKSIETQLQNASASDRVDIGIAFLEMGLYPLASGQFRSAIQQIRYSDAVDPQQIFAATALLAYSLILDGNPYDAVLLLEPAVEESDSTEDMKLEYFYLMGRAFQRIGKMSLATQWYVRVAKIKDNYRDVQSRIKKVAAKK